MEEEGILPDVQLKGIGGPSASCLDDSREGACAGEARSSPRSHRLTSNEVVGKERAEATNEPGSCRTSPSVGEPELRVEWVGAIAGCEVPFKNRPWVEILYEVAYEDGIALVGGIGFVSGEDEGVRGGVREGHCMA